MPRNDQKMKVLILAVLNDKEFGHWLRSRLDDGRFNPHFNYLKEDGFTRELLNEVLPQYKGLVIVMSKRSWQTLISISEPILNDLKNLYSTGYKIVIANIEACGNSIINRFHEVEIEWKENAEGKDLKYVQAKADKIKEYLLKETISENIAEVNTDDSKLTIDLENSIKSTVKSKQVKTIGNKSYLSNDVSTSEDKLGFIHYVDAFIDLITSPQTGTPLTIGIYGNWGIGKSSLMKMLGERIKKYRYHHTSQTAIKNVHHIYFDAWEYNSCEAIWPALVRKIIDKIQCQCKWWWCSIFSRIKRDYRKNVTDPKNLAMLCILWIIAIAYLQTPRSLASALPYGGNVVSFVDNVTYTSLVWPIAIILLILLSFILLSAVQVRLKPVDSWISRLFSGFQYGDKIAQIADIEWDLEFLGNQLKKKQQRFVIVIDDLDRCEPAKAVEMLQAIKLLLDIEGIVVVLGIDARVITAAVDHCYRDVFEEAGISGYEYLEKIVQVPFRIPESSDDDIKIFMSDLMSCKEKDELISNTENQSVSKDYSNNVNELEKENSKKKKGEDNSKNQEEGISSKIERLDMTFSTDEKCAFQDNIKYLEHNPRHIKRLMNIYLLVRSLAIRKNIDVVLGRVREVVRWLVMSTQWPYTANRMIMALRQSSTDMQGQNVDVTPLAQLYQSVKNALDGEQVKKYDSDSARLEKLVSDVEDSPTWEMIEALWPLTISFNPIVEAVVKQESNGTGNDKSANKQESADS